jgi:hypothetical protein
MANLQAKDVAKAVRSVLEKHDGEAQKLSKVRPWAAYKACAAALLWQQLSVTAASASACSAATVAREGAEEA